MADEASEGKVAGAASPPLMEGIAHPGLNDVMFGRGGDTNYHIGNHRFRVLADEHRQEYRSASRKEKALVVQEVVRIWRGRGGRFLTKTDPEKGDESLWNDVGDTVAKKKAAKILSEKAPEERNQKDNEDGGGKDDRKRPAVEAVDADRPAKQATLSPPTPAAKQPTLITASVAGQGMVAQLTNAGGLSFQQTPVPVQQAALASALQLPLQFPLTPLGQQAQSPAALQQALQLPLAGGVPPISQTVRDMLSTQLGGGLSSNQTLLSSLGAGGGVNPTDGSSALVVAARALLQRHEQDAARSRALLAQALLLNSLTTGNNNQATPRLPGTNTTLNASLTAARMGLTPEQLSVLVASPTNGGTNTTTNGASNSEGNK